MKINEVRVHLIALDSPRPQREMFVIPGQTRVQFDRRARPGSDAQHLALIRVVTDAGIEGYCSAFYTWGPARAFAETWLDAFRHELVGADPLDREYIYQKLWFANRFNWLHPWMLGYADVALWDIAGKVANLPVCKLLGGFRDRIPTYVSSGNYPTLEQFVEFGLRVQAGGFKGYKLHSRLGPEMDIRVARAVREALGPDYALMHDPVQTYTTPEALRVGRALEELNYKKCALAMTNVWPEHAARESWFTRNDSCQATLHQPCQRRRRKWRPHGYATLARGSSSWSIAG